MGDEDGRVKILTEDALEMLDVVDGMVHAFTNPQAGMLVGADWDLDDAQELIEMYGAERAGEQAAAMGHGLAVVERTRTVFFKTKDRT